MKYEGLLELYIHIPFCVSKCGYCDFLSFPADDNSVRDYIIALRKELRMRAQEAKDDLVVSVFIGGGTPTSISAFYITGILKDVKEYYHLAPNAEISIEANPGTLSLEKMTRYKNAGVNRVSIGLQSANAETLKRLGRIHTYEDFLTSYEYCRRAGITDINVDLMCGIPGQSVKEWADTLKKVVMLHPKHISAYSLMVEEGTPFGDLYGTDELRRQRGEDPESLPTEEEERQMVHMAQSYLESHGYHRYEISNYAQKGYECRHNVGYWKRVPYLGIGLGASSLYREVRMRNEEKIPDYIGKIDRGAFPVAESAPVSRREQIEEYMFLGLRLTEGISREDFSETFEVEVEALYGSVIKRLCAQKLLEAREGWIYLTGRGTDVSNYVLAQFLLPKEEEPS